MQNSKWSDFAEKQLKMNQFQPSFGHFLPNRVQKPVFFEIFKIDASCCLRKF
jgi:hypothetical protein